MPLVVSTLEADILSILAEMREQSENPGSSDQLFASKLALAIDSYIKTGTVTVQPGITLVAGPNAGATTGPGTGSIS